MGKALMGAHASPTSLRLMDEVRALRQRVAELERALAEAEAARDARQVGAETHAIDADAIEVGDREPIAT